MGNAIVQPVSGSTGTERAGGLTRDGIERRFARQVAALLAHPAFDRLESGLATRAEYDSFIENVVRTHMNSPRIVAFLYSMAPPDAAEGLLHNLLEELGIADQASHPSLLRELVQAAGLGGELPRLEAASLQELRQLALDPLIYGTLKEFGLSALIETVAFEFMLSRAASRMARALRRHRGLDEAALAWFSHHAEVDIEHAEQGLDCLLAYAQYYAITGQDAATIIDMTLRENVFVRRYFGRLALAADA